MNKIKFYINIFMSVAILGISFLVYKAAQIKSAEAQACISLKPSVTPTSNVSIGKGKSWDGSGPPAWISPSGAQCGDDGPIRYQALPVGNKNDLCLLQGVTFVGEKGFDSGRALIFENPEGSHQWWYLGQTCDSPDGLIWFSCLNWQ